MMRITHKLAFATACLAICSAVTLKPAIATDNNLSGQLIAQSFNDDPFVEEAPITSDSREREEDVEFSDRENSNDRETENSTNSVVIPFLWGLGGYMIGSLIGTNKTYTKMNKGR